MGWFSDNLPQLTQAMARQPATPAAGPTAMPVAPAQQPANYQSYFNQLFPGGTLSPAQLAAAEDQLKSQGIRLLGPNARGERTKIELPTGQVIDVIGGAGSGANRRQWMVDTGGGRGGAAQYGGNLPPGYWTGQETGGGRYPLAAAGGPGLAAPWTTPFTPPTGTDDPGFQFAMEQGQKALERSAAARGTLLTGGALKDLANYSIGAGLQGYGESYNRALGQYNLARDIYGTNTNNLYNRLSNIAGSGQIDNSGAAGQMANTITGRGDALAQGQLNAGGAYANAAQQFGNIGSSIPMWYAMQNQQTGYPPAGGGYYGTPVPPSAYTPQPGRW